MNLFGNKPQERAMQRLVHDTNSATDRMRFNIQKMAEWLRVNGKEEGIGTEVFIRMEYIKTAQEELQKSIDLYYNRFSNDFAEDETLLPRTPSLETEEALRREVAWLRQRYNSAKQRLSIVANYYQKKYKELKEASQSAPSAQ